MGMLSFLKQNLASHFSVSNVSALGLWGGGEPHPRCLPGPIQCLQVRLPRQWAGELTSVSKTKRDGPWPRPLSAEACGGWGLLGWRSLWARRPRKTHTWASTPAGRAPSPRPHPREGSGLAGSPDPRTPQGPPFADTGRHEGQRCRVEGLRVPHPSPEPRAGRAPRRAL